MLTRVDRIQLAVPDRRAAAAGWAALLGAEPAGEQRIACVAAQCSRYRLGRGWIDLLEPDGAGPVADAVARRGGHLFAAGAATDDLDALVAHLRSQGVEPALEGGQAHLDPAATGGIGLRVVLSPEAAQGRVGDVDFLYEVTLLVHDAPAAVDRCASLFGLDASAFVPIESKQYGYAGTLTLFDRERLGRFEVITPNDPGNTMGRFFARVGEAFYDRGDGRGADTVFLHPPALGGMMLGLSRPTMAWQWSGHPERVQAAS
jgi:hypothetical protein